MAVRSDTGQQRRLEPATVLIRTFQIQVRRELQLFTGFAHRGVGHTGVEPHVEGINDFDVISGFVAQQLRGLQVEPGINAFAFDFLGYLFNQLSAARVQFAGVFVH